MAIDSVNFPNDAKLLYDYLGAQVQSGDDRPAPEVIADLQRYSAQLEQLRRMVADAENSLADGRARELDVDALLQRVKQRMSDDGNASA